MCFVQQDPPLYLLQEKYSFNIKKRKKYENKKISKENTKKKVSKRLEIRCTTVILNRWDNDWEKKEQRIKDTAGQEY